MKRQYPAIIEKEPGSAYGITFPDFPGCVSAGPNAEAALLNAAEALAGPVALMFVASEPLPDPTPFEAVTTDPDISVVCLALVPVALPGRA